MRPGKTNILVVCILTAIALFVPGIVYGSNVLPKSAWTLHYVDSEETAEEDGAATNAFDGDTATIWHTQWSGEPDPAHPHEIQIDLGATYEVNAFRYQPRNSACTNGTIADYALYVSTDGAAWGSPVATGVFANDSTLKEVTFTPVFGRYVRLVALSEVNGNAWASAGELDVLQAHVAQQVNLLSNAGFENEMTGWAKSGPVDVDTQYMAAGQQSLKLTPTTTAWTSCVQSSVPVTEGSEYIVYAHIKTVDIADGAKAQIRIQEYDNGDTFLRDSYFFPTTGTTDWTKKENIFTPGVNTSKVSLRIVTGQGTGLAYFDDVFLGENLETPTTIAHWNFNEGTGILVSDASGNGNSGTVNDCSWVTGIKGTAISLNGSSSFIDFGTGPSLSGQVDFTISLWVKTTSGNSHVLLQQRGPGYDGEYILNIGANHDATVTDPGKIYFLTYGGGVLNEVWSAATVNDGNWHHVAAVANAAGCDIYIDGNLAPDAEISGGKATLDNTFSTVIGKDNRKDDKYFSGVVDEVSIYGIALSGVEISGMVSSFTPPVWDTTTGIQSAVDDTTGGSVTIEFGSAADAVDGTNIKYNLYYASTSSWDNAVWSNNTVVADITVVAGATYAHAYTLTGLTDGVEYTFGVRVVDQSGNEDANTVVLTETPSLASPDGDVFADGFETNTLAGYTVVHTKTDGGIPSAAYDASGQRLQLLTGDDIKIKIVRDLPAAMNGSFRCNLLPTQEYPFGGNMWVRLMEDANNYYELLNTDGYGPGAIRQVINGVVVAEAALQSEYTQNNEYGVAIDFTPTQVTVTAYGETVTLTPASSLLAQGFEIELEQQDAYVDNIAFSAEGGADAAPPTWDTTTGIQSAVDNATGRRVTIEFGSATDAVDGANITYNLYYAPTSSWDNAVWSNNTVVADITVVAGATYAHAYTLTGLTDGVEYTFGVRVVDQSGNEDANTVVLTETPSLASPDGDVFADGFETNTLAGYTVVHTKTDGGIPSAVYDASGQRLQLLTGDDIKIKIVRDLPAAMNGSFRCNLLPTQEYPFGGNMWVRLMADADNYYELLNTDGYGPGALRQVVAGSVVAEVPLQSEYTQNNEYGVAIDFTPTQVTVTAYGETVTLTPASSLLVQGFEIELEQQDAYVDNIAYTASATDIDSVNLLSNAGFEDGFASWSYGGPVVISTQYKVSGQRSIELSPTTTGWTSCVQLDVPVSQGLEYLISAYIKTVAIADGAKAQVRIEEYDESSTFLRDSYYFPTTGTVDWTKKESIFIPGANTTKVKCRLVTGQGSGLAYFDDLFLGLNAAASDTAPPTWDTTTGIQSAVDDATGGSVTIEFGSANDAVDGTNIKYNLYYASTSSWDNAVWSNNTVVADITVVAGATYAHAYTLTGLTDGVDYTFGVRVVDQSGNEDANTVVLTETPSLASPDGDVFADGFETNTLAGYTVVHTKTDGGIPSAVYDASGQRLQLLTGDDIKIKIVRDLPAAMNGSFRCNLLPTQEYPFGGNMWVRLMADADNYYELLNTDGYGPGALRQVVAGSVVAEVPLQSEYTQNNEYGVAIDFTPTQVTVTAYGETVTLTPASSLLVQGFEIELEQQDAYVDNIAYTASATDIDSVNLLSNAGFEDGFASWSYGGPVVISTQYKVSGQRSIELSPTTTGWTSCVQLDVPVSQGLEYLISAYIKTVAIADGAKAQVRIEEYDESSTFLRDSYYFPTTGTVDWTKKESIFIPGANTTKVKCRLVTGQGSGLAYFDDLFLGLNAAASDTAPPTWDTTTGIQSAVDDATGGSVTIEFGSANDAVDGTNIKYNLYYASTSSWDNAVWSNNTVVADITVVAGATYAHAYTLTGLTDGVEYTFGVRVVDQSGNEDANTVVLTETPSLASPDGDVFADGFETNTLAGYTVVHTKTDGGIPSAAYDASGQRLQLLTGDDIKIKIVRDLPAAMNGSFRCNLLPTQEYPFGGNMWVRLMADADNYYELLNTDGYGPGAIRQVINGVVVAEAALQNEYTQNTEYGVSINFAPTLVTVTAYGETVTLTTASSLLVQGFEIELEQQDAYVDNIAFSAEGGADAAPPTWDTTTGIQSAVDNATGRRVTIEFGSATDAVDAANVTYNIYYALSSSWDNDNWANNAFILDAATTTGTSHAYAYTFYEFVDGVSYTIGVRAQDQSGNLDGNQTTLTVTTTGPDTDSDGLPDTWEEMFFGDMTQTGSDDFDSDGIDNQTEYQQQTDARYNTVGCMDRSAWSLHYVDSEEVTVADGAATNAFDGDTTSKWHTEWGGDPDPVHPHEIQIDLGATHEISGFRYLPRIPSYWGGAMNGAIADYEFYVSTDGSTWGSPVASGTFTNDATQKEVTFTPLTCRYIRLVALSEVTDLAFTSVAELDVVETVITSSAPVISFTADKNASGYGEAVLLSWSVEGADTVSIDNGIGWVSPDGSLEVYPLEATITYTLTATGSGGTTTASLEIGCLVIRVPSDHTTIQAAADAATDGYTVLVADGTYSGTGNVNLELRRKAITVRSENGPENCIIECANASQGFYLRYGAGTGENTTVSGFTIRNGVSDLGGGISIQDSSPTIENCVIEDCTGTYGGGIYVSNGSPNISSCAISESSGSYAGGLYLSSSSAVITNCRVLNNLERGLYCSGGGFSVISGSEITGNTGSQGGGVLFSGSSGEIDSSNISNNTASSGGGGIYLQNSPITIRNCNISNNVAEDGGGIYAMGTAAPLVEDCVIDSNQAYSDSTGCCTYGGGIASFDAIIITGCVIKNNTAANSDDSASDGGGVYLSGQFTVANTMLFGNAARAGGAMRFYQCGPSSEVLNCTISDNSATYLAGGLFCHEATLSIKNTIIVNNTDTGPYSVYGNLYLHGEASPVFSHCNIQSSQASGDGCINTDAGFVGDGDYHLRADSPCKDAGTADGAPAMDIDGDPRPLHAGVDMGADEYREHPPEISLTASPAFILPGDEAVISWHVDMADTVSLDGGIGTVGPDGTVRVTPNKTTTYTLMASGVGGVTSQTVTVKIVAGHRVPDDFITIQAAVEGAGENDTITVADGIYPGGIDFAGKNLTLRSENGPGECIIDSEGSGRGFSFTNNETLSAVVSGFTIRNGDVEYEKGGGIYINNASPTISGCIIENNNTLSYGGGIYCYSSNARILSCLIRSNASGNLGGGIFCNSNTMAEIINCTVVGNSAGNGGGGLYCKDGSSPVVANCILSDNGANQIIVYKNSAPEISYSFIEGGYSGGIGLLACPPDFDESGYRLSVDAYGIDCGLPFSFVTRDVAGKNRIYGNGPDIGAYEVKKVQPLDSDGDGLDDEWEMTHFGNLDQRPMEDPDADGMDNFWEFQKGSDPLTAESAGDTDGDLLPDSLEMTWFRSLDGTRDGDPDSDGLTNLQEYQLGMRPAINDYIDCGDDDGLPDLWEFENFGNLTTYGPDDDPDGDGYTNLEEYFMNSDPLSGGTETIVVHTSVTGNGTIVAEGEPIDANGDITMTADFDTPLTLTFVPDALQYASDVRVDYVSRGAADSFTFQNRSRNHTVHVTFSEDQRYTITPSCGSGGAISPSTPVKVEEGGGADFEIIPDEGLEIFKLVINGEDIWPVDSYSFRGVTSDQTIEAVFTQAPGPAPTCGNDFIAEGDLAAQWADAPYLAVEAGWEGVVHIYPYATPEADKGPDAIAYNHDTGEYLIIKDRFYWKRSGGVWGDYGLLPDLLSGCNEKSIDGRNPIDGRLSAAFYTKGNLFLLRENYWWMFDSNFNCKHFGRLEDAWADPPAIDGEVPYDNIKNDGINDGPDAVAYIENSDKWTIVKNGKYWIRKKGKWIQYGNLSDLWVGAPENCGVQPYADITAAYYIDQQLVVFRDNLYWIIRPLSFYVNTLVEGEGGVTPSTAEEVCLGGDLAMEFTPAPGHYLRRLTINDDLVPGAPGSYAFTDISSDKTISVWFLPEDVVDQDGDGLNDLWQETFMPGYYGGACPNCGDTDDYDGDGINNYQEYVLGWNPGEENSDQNGNAYHPGVFYEYDALGRIVEIIRIPGE